MSRLDLEERKIKRCLKTSLRTEVSLDLSFKESCIYLVIFIYFAGGHPFSIMDMQFCFKLDSKR